MLDHVDILERSLLKKTRNLWGDIPHTPLYLCDTIKFALGSVDLSGLFLAVCVSRVLTSHEYR